MALRSLAGASEQFETFLSHRGEEMGSIRGRVRIHVPKDRRGTREKLYGGSAGTGRFLPSALLALSLPTKLSSPLSLQWLSCESHIASSIWFLNDPWLGFTLAGIYRPLPLLAPDRVTLTRCILRHWNRTDEYYVTRSGTTTTHTNTTTLCDYKLTRPLAYTRTTQTLRRACLLQNALFISCDFTFSEWFYFEKDPGRGHMSPATTRVPINRWGPLRVFEHQCTAAESLQLSRKGSVELFETLTSHMPSFGGLQIPMHLWSRFTCYVKFTLHCILLLWKIVLRNVFPSPVGHEQVNGDTVDII